MLPPWAVIKWGHGFYPWVSIGLFLVCDYPDRLVQVKSVVTNDSTMALHLLFGLEILDLVACVF